MRRTLVSFVLASSLVAATVGAVSAAPDKGCPADESGFTPVALNFTWEHGDALPGAGVDAWWDLLLAAFAAEGETPESVAASYGLGSVVELYELALVRTRPVDKNGDGWICWQAYPEQQGAVGFFYNLTDGNAAQQ
jgi:hypothetical protein